MRRYVIEFFTYTEGSCYSQAKTHVERRRMWAYVRTDASRIRRFSGLPASASSRPTWKISVEFKQRHCCIKVSMDGAPKERLVIVPSTMLKSSLALLTAALFCSGVSALGPEASIASAASSNLKCIQVKGSSFAEGMAIVMSACHPLTSQTWGIFSGFTEITTVNPNLSAQYCIDAQTGERCHCLNEVS
ncbi:hypothetical protein AX14_003716 [Amanita brunnescens Koide BX004]|nr:hypothetical protein AX14_003716 [Amanita brunnescens Koide BX004]